MGKKERGREEGRRRVKVKVRKKGEKKEGCRTGNITKFEHNSLLPSPPTCCTVCIASDHRQGSRVWCRRSLQPDPAAAHVPHAGGPGETSSCQGH